MLTVREAASFVARATLLKILQGELLDHFRSSQAHDAFFAQQGLTRADLPRERQKRTPRGA